VLEDDVAHRLHRPAGGVEVESLDLRQHVLLPALAPPADHRPDVPQALEAEEVGGQRDQDVVGGEQRGPVDRAEVRSHVDEGDLGADLGRAPLHDAVEGRRGPQRRLVAVVAARPHAREVVLEAAEPEVSGEHVQPLGDLLGGGTTMSPSPRRSGFTPSVTVVGSSVSHSASSCSSSKKAELRFACGSRSTARVGSPRRALMCARW